MEEKRFNPANLERLNNPEREKEFPLDVILYKTKIELPEVIVDLGAGTGFFSIPFAEEFPDSRIYACDISDKMVNWLKENVASKYKNIIPLKMDDSKVPLNSSTADFLFMVNLHHELDNPEETLMECHRLLKSKGKIAISDWRKEIMDHGPSIEIRYEPDEVKAQLLNTGFQNIIIDINFPNNFLIIAEKQ
jgi:ubiquinone/menaquinone biosynthesis C-methylase UbiE